MTSRLSALHGTNEKPPGGNRGATVLVSTEPEVRAAKGAQTLLAQSTSGRNTRGVSVSYPSIFAIQAAVALRCGVSTLDLVSDRRCIECARPRQLAMWVARHTTLGSLSDIGRAFGRDPSTVRQALRRVEALLRSDPEFAWQAVQLRYQFQPREMVA